MSSHARSHAHSAMGKRGEACSFPGRRCLNRGVRVVSMRAASALLRVASIMRCQLQRIASLRAAPSLAPSARHEPLWAVLAALEMPLWPQRLASRRERLLHGKHEMVNLRRV